MFNTIILKCGNARLTNDDMERFEKYDTIYGIDSNPIELQRWSIDQEEEAKAALSELRCTYARYNDYLTNIEEYALEYCECDEDGEFLEGSDYDFAADEIVALKNSFDKDIYFEDLEEAKKYFKPSEEKLEEHLNMDPSEFLGDPEDFEEYKNNFYWYAEKIEYAKTLEELADVLNEYSDIYGNGSRYSVEVI